MIYLNIYSVNRIQGNLIFLGRSNTSPPPPSAFFFPIHQLPVCFLTFLLSTPGDHCPGAYTCRDSATEIPCGQPCAQGLCLEPSALLSVQVPPSLQRKHKLWKSET